MKATRRLEITTETHELKIIRFRKSVAVTIFCAECQKDTPHLTLAEAVSVLSVSENDVCLLVHDKKIHATKNCDGKSMLCGYSCASLAIENI